MTGGPIAPGTVLRATCPTCGVEVVQELTGYGLWVEGEPEWPWNMEHDADGQWHRWQVLVGATVTLQAVEGCTVEVRT